MTGPLRFTAYYGMRRFLLLAPTFVIEPATPYRRLTPTLLLACKRPFEIVIDDDAPRTARAALVAPKVLRRRLIAVDSDLVIFDLPIHSTIPTAPIEVLDPDRFASLLPALADAFPGRLPCGEVDRMFEEVLTALAGRSPPPLDARIEQALHLIDELPFDEVTLPGLARRLALSPSRLRHLFKAVTGHTVSHYARWAAVWRAIALWSRGRLLTEIAHEVGFHDLAHLDHADPLRDLGDHGVHTLLFARSSLLATR